MTAPQARVFEPGFSTDYTALQTYLDRNDIEMKRVRALYQVKWRKERKPSKFMTWTDVINVVDEIRIQQGLQPIKVRHLARRSK